MNRARGTVSGSCWSLFAFACFACGESTGGSPPPGGSDGGEDAGADVVLAPPCAPDRDGDCTIGPSFTPAPEMTVAPGTPRGTVIELSMSSSTSKVFPGLKGAFSRGVWAYIPAQYVDGTEAPLMVVQDGGVYLERVVAALDSMIAAKSLPPMIGVFVNPGPGDGPGSDRGLEYDRVSEDYTTFVETEVLPFVLAAPKVLAARPKIALTKNPDGRATMGASSGGAAAFTMAWFRPDLYRRVLTYSGTFVKQHSDANHPNGAWEYHQKLIAEAPKKPLRVFLEVGENDLNLDELLQDGMHSWVASNRAMAAVLKSKGYDYRFVFAVGASHVDDRVVTQTLPDALRFVWRGYPTP